MAAPMGISHEKMFLIHFAHEHIDFRLAVSRFIYSHMLYIL